MGTAQLNARQMADWFESTGMPYRLAGGMSIRELAQIFIEEGADEDVRGDVAFAQSVLETGYFRWAIDNNYAGLGACDSCSGEPSFPSPRDGVRAQIQHLKNYGDPDSRTPGLAHLAVAHVVRIRSRASRCGTSTPSSPRAGPRHGR